MRVTPDGQPRISRTFDLSVLAIAVALTLATVDVAGVELVGAGTLEVGVWLCAPLIALFSRYPVHLDRPSGAIEIGVDSCVLAYLGTTMERPYQAMLVWSSERWLPSAWTAAGWRHESSTSA